MEYSESKKKYNLEYAKKKLKRIPLDVQVEKYEEIKTAAATSTAILKKPLMNGCNGIKVISKILPLFRGAFSVKI